MKDILKLLGITILLLSACIVAYKFADYIVPLVNPQIVAPILIFVLVFFIVYKLVKPERHDYNK